jgi:pimeloyl-ACP methyl ester carboxylesterase
MAKLTMPRLGETMEQGTVRAWLIKPGVPFKRGDVIAEIETDKTVVELPALDGGTVERFVANEGDVVEVGGTLAELVGVSAPSSRMEEEPAARMEPAQGMSQSAKPSTPVRNAASPFTPNPSPGHETGPRPLASPAARKLAKKQGIDLSSITGTGRQGRIQGWDVRAAASVPVSAVTATLHASERGDGNATPLVLLHGFGGDKDGWLNLAVPLSQNRKVISFDLPGHGGSHAIAASGLQNAAELLRNNLQQRGAGKVHLAGHSMGGGVALALAMLDPQVVASLTLFAPAGVSSEINARLLRAYAKATDEATLAVILDQFFGADAKIPKGLATSIAAARKTGTSALQQSAEAMLDGNNQRPLALDRLATIEVPIRIVWGVDDHVLPMMPNTRKLPGVVAVHRYARVGHMPQIEIGRDAIRLTQLSMGAT